MCGTSEEEEKVEEGSGGSTTALFRAGACVGSTYMQMRLHRITAQIPPSLKKISEEESLGSQVTGTQRGKC